MILLILTIVIALALCVYLFKRNNAGAEQNLCGKIALVFKKNKLKKNNKRYCELWNGKIQFIFN